MQRKPYGGFAGVGPFDAMTAMGGNPHVIPRTQFKQWFLVFKPQASLALKQYYPFVLHLIIPIVSRRCVSTRNDTFQPISIPLREGFKEFIEFIGRSIGNIGV